MESNFNVDEPVPAPALPVEIAAIFGNALRTSMLIPFALEAKKLSPNRKFSESEANYRLLTTLAELDERQVCGDELDGIEADLAGLHCKVDLLIHALGALLQRQNVGPLIHQVELSAMHVAWNAVGKETFLADSKELQDEMGDDFIAQLHVHPILLMPLRINVRMIMAQENWRVAALTGISDRESSALERLIFLRHRRLVGERRTLSRKLTERS